MNPNARFFAQRLLFIGLMFTGLIASLIGQHAYTRQGKMMAGFSAGSSGFTARDPVTREESWAFTLTIQPRIGVFIADRFLIAAQGEILLTRSSFPIPWLNDEYYGLGGLGRYYFFVLPNLSPFSKPQVQERVRGFCEVGGYWKNGDTQGDSLVALPGLPIFEVQVGAGINVRLVKGLCLEMSMFYVNRPDPRYALPFPVIPRLGLEYIIPSTL